MTRVRDHGIEALRRSVEVDPSGDPGDYRVVTTATGVFKPSGLNVAIKTTTLTIGDTATKLPTTPLTDRNSLEVHNLSTTVTLYVGNSNVTADSVTGTTSGKEIPEDSFWSIDITDDIEIYGRCPTGESAQVKITEVA